MSNLLIPEYHYQYWFYRSPEGDGSWIVTNLKTGQFITNYPVMQEAIPEEDQKVIVAAFAEFTLRPEYYMYNNITNLTLPDVPTSDIDITLADMYNKFLAGAMLTRFVATYKDANVGIKRVTAVLDWLESNKFYESPGSTKYHEAYRGGLMLHSLRVLKLLIQLWELPTFKYESLESLVITSLTHDWCKIGLYHSYMKNVKNDETGKWEQRAAYRREITGVPMGHGELSLYYLMKFIPVTDDEALAIRWHMAMWQCPDALQDELQTANERYPLVYMLQFADQLSITEYAN